MADLLSGLVHNVTAIPVGMQLAAPAAIGATVLTVDDAVYLSPTGGQVTIGATVVDYVASDDDADSVTLAAPLTAALVEGDFLFVYPPRVEVTAMVLVGGSSVPIPATVPWDKQDALLPGVREEEGREKVTLRRDGEFSWTVDDLPDQPLQRDGVATYVPALHAVKGSDDSILNDTWTKIVGWFVYIPADRVTQTFDSFTVAVDGIYDIRLGVTFSANATGNRAVRMHYYNAIGGDAGVSRQVKFPSDGQTTVETAQFRRMYAGDSVEFEAWQNSLATISVKGSNIATAPAATDCAIRWVGPL